MHIVTPLTAHEAIEIDVVKGFWGVVGIFEGWTMGLEDSLEADKQTNINIALVPLDIGVYIQTQQIV